MAVTFGCTLPSRGPMASTEALRALAQRAEDLSFDSVWVSDHIILPRQVESDRIRPFGVGIKHF